MLKSFTSGGSPGFLSSRHRPVSAQPDKLDWSVVCSNQADIGQMHMAGCEDGCMVQTMMSAGGMLFRDCSSEL